MTEDSSPSGVEIPPTDLSPEALRGVIENYVSREGTDYGEVEWSFEQKVAQVELLLQRGEARLVFDPLTESCTILPATERFSRTGNLRKS